MSGSSLPGVDVFYFDSPLTNTLFRQQYQKIFDIVVLINRSNHTHIQTLYLIGNSLRLLTELNLIYLLTIHFTFFIKILFTMS